MTVLPPPPPDPLPVPTITPELTLLDAPMGTAADADPPAAHADGEEQIDEAYAESTEAPDGTDEAESDGSFFMLGERVAPGTFSRLTWTPTETFTGNAIPSAVLVANGTKPGPTLCLTAAVHGDELNGIETVRRVLHDIDPKRLTGTVVGVPIVNLQGFHRNSRYLPDRRDLNRFFPGNPTGSSASRIAHSLFSQVIEHCSALVDLHTGSFHRTNLPQLRANLNVPEVVALTQGFGSTVILHSGGAEGTLRDAATAAGIPAVTLEAGMPMQVQEDAVSHGVKGIFTLLDTLGMYNRRSLWGNPEPVYYQSRWVRADHGGILAGAVRLGRRVKPGDLLGTVIDPISNATNEILSPFQGRVIGMALDQFVMPGYATFHIGIEAEVAEVTESPPEDDVDHAIDDHGSPMDGD
ncbi:MAG: succinylglutamate desuccinylase/aspartoacylase family protein [Pseudomonadales bacterium]